MTLRECGEQQRHNCSMYCRSSDTIYPRQNHTNIEVLISAFDSACHPNVSYRSSCIQNCLKTSLQDSSLNSAVADRWNPRAKFLRGPFTPTPLEPGEDFPSLGDLFQVFICVQYESLHNITINRAEQKFLKVISHG